VQDLAQGGGVGGVGGKNGGVGWESGLTFAKEGGMGLEGRFAMTGRPPRNHHTKTKTSQRHGPSAQGVGPREGKRP